MSSKDIAIDLKDGIHEIYGELYSECFYIPFDRNTPSNIYKESLKKYYLSPLSIVAQIKIVSKDERTENNTTYGVTIKVPVKSFELLDFEINPKDYNYVMSGLFLHENIYYKIKKIEIGNLIQNEVMSYTFTCERSDENGN